MTGSFDHWAWEALALYDLRNPEIQFIGHSEHITYRVVESAGGKAYLLRLHFPKTINFRRMDNGLCLRPEAIESEMMWLEALGRETDIPVQRPVLSRDGKLVAFLQAEEAIPCTLMEWIEGEPLYKVQNLTSHLANRLGALAARLQNHASRWQRPAGFIRPSYGFDFLKRLEASLAAGVEQGIIRSEDFAVFQDCFTVIVGRIEESGSILDDLIHADLHHGNVLVHGEELCPIDFSFCGTGDAMFDVSFMINLPTELRPAYLEGYRALRPVTEDDLLRVEGWSLAGFLGYCSLVLPNPAHHDWLRERLPKAAANECRSLLRGEVARRSASHSGS